jgi:hypothetical protein
LFQRSDKAVALAGNGLQESWVVGIVPQRLADFANSYIDSGIRIDENIFAPQFVDNLDPADQVSVARYQEEQKLHWNSLHTNRVSLSPQFKRRRIQLKLVELNRRGRHLSPYEACQAFYLDS